MQEQRTAETRRAEQAVRRLVVVLGDQLDLGSAAFHGFDSKWDLIWMCEATDEATHVWSHQQRIALFLSAMRHFRERCLAMGLRVRYHAADAEPAPSSLYDALFGDLQRIAPKQVVCIEPGDYRVRQLIERACSETGVPCAIRPDTHFLCSVEVFREWADGKRLRMEPFYRWMRQRTGALMDGEAPLGGRWNYDTDNRHSFGRTGPPTPPPVDGITPDALTRDVIGLVKLRYGTHPGVLRTFDWPVTPDDAMCMLDQFVERALPQFGHWQDAMWRGQPVLFHSRLAAAMNLKLLDPRVVIGRVEQAVRDGVVPLNSGEGFIRQILGWREYVHGVYHTFMPEYAMRNVLNHHGDLPGWYWTGRSEMACLREVIGQTLERAYAHHIQRLMVTGLYCLLLGVQPQQVHAWYLAVYADAVEWVELPNTLGMSQYADGGVMASRPYCASGSYIRRMSNYCDQCRYRPDRSNGVDACPYNMLYRDFLIRHEELLRRNPLSARNLSLIAKMTSAERNAVQREADAVREQHA